VFGGAEQDRELSSGGHGEEAIASEP
jgi:hypothetical protein